MYCEHDMNLKEIAAVLKVTESRVCQLHSQSIARLSTRLREWQGRGAKLPEHMSAVEDRSAA
jgi:hypothetical protein